MTILEQYKNYIKNLPTLLQRFGELDITHKWPQVMTSRSTGIMGTGIAFSSVSADYKLQRDGSFKLLNRAYNSDFKPVFISGLCKCADNTVPTCRTVKFDDLFFEGDYWITYISADKSTFIVSAPLILLGKVLTPNFGLYVLTRDRDKYWTNDALQAEINAVLLDYDFTSYWNKPVFSGQSKPIITADATISDSRFQGL
jgi:hypothetical protein